MNAKKIMGAVLVALLAAALFVGAGSAALGTDAATQLNATTGTTIYFYQNVTNGTGIDLADLQGSWTSADGKATIKAVATTTSSFYFVQTENTAEGVYVSNVNDTHKIILAAPSAAVSITTGVSSTEYPVLGGVTYGDNVNVTATSALTLENYILGTPDGSSKMETFSSPKTVPAADTGAYTIQLTYNGSMFVVDTPADYLKTPVYTFSKADADEITVSVNVESVKKQDVVAVTINAIPFGPIELNLTKFNLTSWGELDTAPVNKPNAAFLMPKTGKAVVYVTAVDSGDGEIKATLANNAATEPSQTVKITVEKGAITAKTDKEAYFIGDDVTISGTSTASNYVYFYIAGTNKDYKELNFTTGANANRLDVKKGEWSQEFDGSLFKTGYDAGTYTVYITSDTAPTDEDLKGVTYITAPLVLKQPFISVTDAPTVAVKNTEYKVTGTAEAAKDLYVYIFGTNFFAAANKDAPASGSALTGTELEVKLDGNEFTVTVDVPEDTYDMATGQYFMVIQHPMYDEDFNIAPITNGAIYKNATGDATTGTGGSVIMSVTDRQKANAAQALCDELDAQNIDDMYVKLSFVVANGESTINPIPSEITKGSKLTISGQTNTGGDKTVTVEMLSTAFAAVPKETVGSASFISLTTKTNDDGTWEITFDTTGLNIDEYIVSASVEGFKGSTTAKINVIEGAPTEQPTENPTEQPTQTEQPTEAPTTPGFGALAALAGLGAVAVLLLRRE